MTVPIHFRCLHCNHRLSVDRRKAGQTMPCPACKTKMNVPGAGPAPAEPGARATSVLPWLLLGGAAIAFPLGGLVIAGALLLAYRIPTAATTPNPAPVAEVKPSNPLPRRIEVLDDPPAPPVPSP
jgi:hypothetical protein